MKIRKNQFAQLIAAALLVQFANPALTCTAVIAGKSATANNSMFVGRNEDFGNNNWAKHLVYRPARTTSSGEQWDFGDGLVVPMPEVLYAYSAIPDWDAATMNQAGMYFEERGVNAFNVAISATNSADVNEKAAAADPLIEKGGISEAVIPSLILPQVKTAKAGVELLGEYIKNYGASEANILYFVDDQELWMMEIGSGHHWIAVKVPDDAYVVIANSLRIHDVDLNSADVLHSEGLLSFVEANALLDEIDAQSFNFAKAFGVLGDHYNVDRVWLGQKMISPSVEQAARQEQYPLFLQPDAPIDLATIKQVLSADYDGTEIESDAQRPMRVETQLESHVIEVRPDKPEALQVVTWQSFGVLPESVLIPLYSSMTSYPEAYSTGTDRYDSNSAYWQFRANTSLANVNAEKYLPFVQQAMDTYQDKVYQDFSQFEASLAADADPEELASASAAFSTEQLHEALSAAQLIQSQMMTDLTKMTEKKYTEKEQAAILALPSAE